MSENTYQPAKVWTWDPEAKGNGAQTNRPFAGPTHEKACQLVNIRFSSIRWVRLMVKK